MIELTFVRVDPDTGNLVYKGTDKNMYISVEGVIHDVTDEMEPDTPAKNVKIKDGEPEYDPEDRFARDLEKRTVEKDLVRCRLKNENVMTKLQSFSTFVNESYGVSEAAKPKGPYIVKVERDRGNGRYSTRYVIGSVEDLVGYFGYTLEIGNSHKRSINKDPKTIAQFMKALSASYDVKEAALYNRTSVDLVDAVPEGTPASEISDQTKNGANEALSAEALDRMDGLAPEKELKQFNELLALVTKAWLDEGFDREDVMDYINGQISLVDQVRRSKTK